MLTATIHVLAHTPVLIEVAGQQTTIPADPPAAYIRDALEVLGVLALVSVEGIGTGDITVPVCWTAEGYVRHYWRDIAPGRIAA
jgi:hypothetical protein